MLAHLNKLISSEKKGIYTGTLQSGHIRREVVKNTTASQPRAEAVGHMGGSCTVLSLQLLKEQWMVFQQVMPTSLE